MQGHASYAQAERSSRCTAAAAAGGDQQALAELLEGGRVGKFSAHVGASLETVSARVKDAVRLDRKGERVREYHLTFDSLEIRKWDICGPTITEKCLG